MAQGNGVFITPSAIYPYIINKISSACYHLTRINPIAKHGNARTP